MILMIDNYDSFTYNLVQYLGELGADVMVERNDQITVDEIKKLKPELIMISPGPCTPSEAGISLDVIEHLRHGLKTKTARSTRLWAFDIKNWLSKGYSFTPSLF